MAEVNVSDHDKGSKSPQSSFDSCLGPVPVPQDGWAGLEGVKTLPIPGGAWVGKTGLVATGTIGAAAREIL